MQRNFLICHGESQFDAGLPSTCPEDTRLTVQDIDGLARYVVLQVGLFPHSLTTNLPNEQQSVFYIL